MQIKYRSVSRKKKYFCGKQHIFRSCIIFCVRWKKSEFSKQRITVSQRKLPYKSRNFWLLNIIIHFSETVLFFPHAIMNRFFIVFTANCELCSYDKLFVISRIELSFSLLCFVYFQLTFIFIDGIGIGMKNSIFL